MTLLLAFLSRAWPYIIAAALAGLVWWRADHWCNSACQAQSVKARTAEGKIRTLEAQIAEAQERATALALLWAAQVDKTEAANRAAEVRRNGTFDELKGRSVAAGAGVRVHLPADAYGLWRDVASAANAARPPSVRETPAAPVSATADAVGVADLNAWIVEAGRAYADAYGQWAACVTHYEAMRRQMETKQ